MKRLFLTFASCCALWVTAQTSRQMQIYFESALRGRQVPLVGKEFSLNRLPAMRAAVWKAWVQANQKLNGPGLPQLDSLSAAPRGQWVLPQQLEPNAQMPFYFGCKGNCPEGGYPFFLYLHGSGPKEREWSNGLILSARFADSPSMYFIPQIPNEGKWYRWWQQSKQFAWELLLRQVLLRKDVNPNRLYVFGISEGGYGSQRLASFYADYWAAAGPMAGGEPLKNAPAENLSNTPFSLLTGANDKGFYRDKLTRYTLQALDSLQQLYPQAYKHRVELIPGRGHHIDYSPTTPWLRSFERHPWPSKYIWEDYEMDGRHRKGFANLLVNQRPSDNQRTRYEVNVQDNKVDINVYDVTYTTTETDSVYGIELKFDRVYRPSRKGSFTIFLNEHMVDLKRPVEVVVNGQKVFADKLTLSTANLQQSLSAFYDPERIFPAAVRVELK